MDQARTEQFLQQLLAAFLDRPEQFGSLCAAVPDWDSVWQGAQRHRLSGLLYHQCAQAGCPLPLAVRQDWERQSTYEQLRQDFFRSVITQVLDALHDAGTRVVPLKGPILAERIYPDPTLRPCDDLDLLVHPDQVEQAMAALVSIGYEVEEGPIIEHFRRHGHHLVLHHRRWPAIELHFRAYAGFGTVLPAEPLLARASEYRTAHGATTWVLAPEDEFLYLSTHAAGHCFTMLSMLYELRLLCRRFPALDGSTIMDQARSLGLLSVVTFTGELMRRRLGGMPPHELTLPAPSRIRWRLASSVLAARTRLKGQSHWRGRFGLAFQAVLCDHLPSLAQVARQQWSLTHHARRHELAKDAASQQR